MALSFVKKSYLAIFRFDLFARFSAIIKYKIEFIDSNISSILLTFFNTLCVRVLVLTPNKRKHRRRQNYHIQITLNFNNVPFASIKSLKSNFSAEITPVSARLEARINVRDIKTAFTHGIIETSNNQKAVGIVFILNI